MKYKEFPISKLFTTIRGKSYYTKGYAKKHAGMFPIYSAGRGAPLGYIDSFDHEGDFLSWTTNGYAGYVQVLNGKFSINSDRGLLVPIDKSSLDLDYCRLVLQPRLRSQAIGRIIDGKKNEYTKLSPTAVLDTVISVPVKKNGEPDKKAQEKLAAKYIKVEAFRNTFEDIIDLIKNSTFPVTSGNQTVSVTISDINLFSLQIGDRVLKKDIQISGTPVYSANVNEIFGYINSPKFKDFSRPALIWGIDGVFDWNIIPSNVPFHPTDHCGVLHVIDCRIDPEYVFYYLKGSKDQYGFDRTYRSSLENMREVVTINIPIDENGDFDILEQRRIAEKYKKMDSMKRVFLNQLEGLITSPISFE